MRKPPYGRKSNMSLLFHHLDSLQDPYIVEIGMTRDLHPYAWMHDGYFTLIMSWYLVNRGVGDLLSIDIDPDALINCRKLLQSYKIPETNLTLVNDDAFQIIPTITRPIDVLYLDAWDYTIHVPEHRIYIDEHVNRISEENHLLAFKEFESHLAEDHLIIIDDVLSLDDYTGKGKMLIPYLLDNGYSIDQRTLQRDAEIKERPVYQLFLRKY